MKTRDTVLGLLVIALVAAGVFFARSGSSPRVEPPLDRSASASSAEPSDDDVLPDATRADASAADGDVRIVLSLTPKPPVTLETFRVRVRAESDGAPVALENGRVSFEMAMPMGDHHYTLVATEQGWLEAKVVLPT